MMVETICSENDLRPNIQVYTCLIQACLQNRSLGQAIMLYDNPYTYLRPFSMAAMAPRRQNWYYTYPRPTRLSGKSAMVCPVDCATRATLSVLVRVSQTMRILTAKTNNLKS